MVRGKLQNVREKSVKSQGISFPDPVGTRTGYPRNRGNSPEQAEVAKSSMKVAKSSRSGIEIYNGEVALLQIGVMITSLEVALSQKYLHIVLYKSIM